MTIDFYGKLFEEYEREHYRPFVGYFSPKGKLVDYNTELGGKHRTIGNIVSWTFLMWIKSSDTFKDLGLMDVEMKASFDKETGIIKNANIPLVEDIDVNLLKLQKDLIELLKVMERDPLLQAKISERIDMALIPESVKKHGLISEDDGKMFEIERVFGFANTTNLLTLLKDILVEYLGYDSIEKIRPNGEYLEYPLNISKEDYSFADRPRTIDTSNKEIHVRFFNYLLMDWKVAQMPGYIYNSQKGTFEELPMGMYAIQSGRDLEYQSEIETIRRLVPRKDRIQFFR